MTTRRPSVCLVTCRELGGLISEDEPLRDALAGAGWSVSVAAWDDPGERWRGHDAVLLRSTWDYHRRPAEFRSWIESCASAGAALWNPAPTLLWNMHKSYLLDLEARGLEVVPTRLVAQGAHASLDALLARCGWSQAVVKPAVSATAWRAFRARSGGPAEEREGFARLLEQGDVLVQPFVEEVVSAGELSFVFFGGRLSHAVLKQAAAGDYRVQEDFGGRARRVDPPAALRARAAAVAEALPHPWLYARIDAVARGDRLLVMEVELIEPQLFLALEPSAAARLAAALTRRTLPDA